MGYRSLAERDVLPGVTGRARGEAGGIDLRRGSLPGHVANVGGARREVISAVKRRYKIVERALAAVGESRDLCLDFLIILPRCGAGGAGEVRFGSRQQSIIQNRVGFADSLLH